MKKKITCIAFILLMAWGSPPAPDIHFSQFYANPLTLNPAMTGGMSGCYRINATYRNQWKNYTQPYRTISAAADFKTLQNRILGNDFVGGGLLLYNDRSGDAGLTVNNVMAAGAYHKLLNSINRLSVGAELGVGQKKLNLSGLVLPQHIGDQTSSEPVDGQLNNTATYFDLQAGLLWTGTDLFLGAVLGPAAGGLEEEQSAALFQRLTPKITFFLPSMAFLTIAAGITLAQRVGLFPNSEPWLALFTAALTTIRDPYGSPGRSARDLVHDLEALPGAIQQVLDREAAIRTAAEQ
jgi:type IX secretion system PorP/SprF family membrane protein